MVGDCRSRLKEIESDSIDFCVTSPPYWGLRDYGVDGQIGLEESVESWVAEMVAVFTEVRRVLKPAGTLWLNLGDSFARDPGKGGSGTFNGRNGRGEGFLGGNEIPCGLKAKDLIGQPWRVAFALQARGWFLRSEIIWHKPNPMPESVTDRPTKSHETVFLLAKSPRYYFDAEAIREEVVSLIPGHPSYRPNSAVKAAEGRSVHRSETAKHEVTARSYPIAGRNSRSVWSIPTAPFPGAHFATFPEALPERCIRAGTSEGVCSSCGAPLERKFKTRKTGRRIKAPDGWDTGPGAHGSIHRDGRQAGETVEEEVREFVGWAASCECGVETRPAVVLDPFFGAGTTGLVAAKLGRSCIGVELNPEYAAIAESRIRDNVGLMTRIVRT